MGLKVYIFYNNFLIVIGLWSEKKMRIYVLIFYEYIFLYLYIEIIYELNFKLYFFIYLGIIWRKDDFYVLYSFSRDCYLY